VGMKVFHLLFREFSDPALALVLERRFPELLGDRLITAVELSDPEAAGELGYSPAMVRQTIQEAAERVQKVPVRQVFNYGRLIRRGIFVVLLTAGLYLLGVATFATIPAVLPASGWVIEPYGMAPEEGSSQDRNFSALAMVGFTDLHDVSD